MEDLREKLQRHSLHGKTAFVNDVQFGYGKACQTLGLLLHPNDRRRCVYHQHDDRAPRCVGR